MEANKLKEILEKHKMWLNGEEGGEKADLSGADLIGADLSGANLRGADLRGTNLRDANLRRADLRVATLRDADLSEADLWDANLSEANLREANLSGADLWDANLSRADLRKADLSKANLRWANLRWADLRGADLRGADLICTNLSEADLREADLRGTNGIPAICCPEEGSFIGFKKACDYIVKLLILDDAKRSSATSRKCRCSKAKVLSITELDGSETDVTEVNSNYDSSFVYRIGETVEVPDFDDDRWNECAPGIHFFITRQEAVEY